ncbi:MAG: chemotaxis protein CheW [Geobacteraceae bacterium]|nr:chemotaxis protein CheW [Geobacteraceae bacterium]
MDLAKIRKKSLQAQEQSVQESVPQKTAVPVATAAQRESADVATTLEENDFFQNVTFPVTGDCDALKSLSIAPGSQKSEPVRDPIEVIMAGRAAAGCDEEIALADEEFSIEVASDLEFLCFRVSDEFYGINIMDIKEIIKPREVTEVPRSPDFVTGVLSLRGTIIPVIDMRLRLGLVRDQVTGKERIVVIKKSNDSFSGLLVDEVIQVVRVNKEAVEPAPAILEGIDRDFVFGIGRSEGRLLIILNLESIADIHLC